MYLLLKASRVNVQNHPVVKRLYQYRQLLSQMNPIFEEIVKPQIEILLNENPENLKKPKSLDMVGQMTKEKGLKKKMKNIAKQKVKKVTFDEILEKIDDKVEQPENSNEISKRAITYQIAKNKGLTPHRKKEQRNPRVKHRNKFRKAKIRRKGAVSYFFLTSPFLVSGF